MKHIIKIIPILFILFLVSCETVEKQEARSMCSQIAYKKFPVKNVSYSCVQTIYKDVEKGEKCRTRRVPSIKFGEYELETVCEKIVEQEPFYENRTCVSDKNATIRRNWINRCSNAACLQTYGNKDCE